MLPVRKSLHSAKNIRQEIRGGNLLFKVTSDSSYAAAAASQQKCITVSRIQASPKPYCSFLKVEEGRLKKRKKRALFVSLLSWGGQKIQMTPGLGGVGEGRGSVLAFSMSLTSAPYSTKPRQTEREREKEREKELEGREGIDSVKTDQSGSKWKGVSKAGSSPISGDKSEGHFIVLGF